MLGPFLCTPNNYTINQILFRIYVSASQNQAHKNISFLGLSTIPHTFILPCHLDPLAAAVPQAQSLSPVPASSEIGISGRIPCCPNWRPLCT